MKVRKAKPVTASHPVNDDVKVENVTEPRKAASNDAAEIIKLFFGDQFSRPTVFDYSPQADPPAQPSGNEAIELTTVASAPSAIRMTDAATEAAGSVATAGAPTIAPSPAVKIVLGNVHGSGTPVEWCPDIAGNPHLMIVGMSGMGKTSSLVNVCRQLQEQKITPIVFSYHDDIDGQLEKLFPDLRKSDCQSLGFNPMRITRSGPLAYVESAGLLRDTFSAIFTDLGDRQLEILRTAFKSSYEACGWEQAAGATVRSAPHFHSFYEELQSLAQNDERAQTLLTRLAELNDFQFFNDSEDGQGFLGDRSPTVLQIHKTANGAVQRAYAALTFYRIYQDMFQRGTQSRITHAVIFDEAHRAAGLKLIPTMAKECRKYGIALILASQEAQDFDESLHATIANYLILRVNDKDARALARNVAPSDMVQSVADELKQMEKYQALYFCGGSSRPVHVDLQC
jgi:hypothetical protein